MTLNWDEQFENLMGERAPQGPCEPIAVSLVGDVEFLGHHMYVCRASANRGQEFGGALATTVESALTRAAFEAAERLTASMVVDSHLGSEPSNAADVTRFLGFAKEQYVDDFPHPGYEPQSARRWVTALDAASGRRVRVPRELAALKHGVAKPLDSRSSNGVAIHTSARLAVQSALAEVLERHVACSNWYDGRPARELAVTDGATVARTTLLHDGGLCATFHELPQAIVEDFIVVAALVRADVRPVVTVGLACGLEAELPQVVAKALDEALMIRWSYPRLDASATDVGLAWRVHHYGEGHDADALTGHFRCSKVGKRAGAPRRAGQTTIIDALLSRNRSVLVVPLWTGLVAGRRAYTVRALVSGFAPIELNERALHLATHSGFTREPHPYG